ncbi:hypothetical protein IWW36_002287 [Coemansia brasiliensis]|uniref:Uncharacterized protein n=1 Tax=Coemansia brasiliensis TaxID=2650707 RepID=A0A9W8I7F9_9FUNG|nr:hypothetical protein IWW36_002287 [Coemansia brasiliensis]
MSESQVYSCTCLNVRAYVQAASSERVALEDTADVLECTLDSRAIQVALSWLVEVKGGSSIDPNINSVRCLLCKTPLLYFRNDSQPAALGALRPQQQQKALPEADSTVYMSKEAKDEQAMLASERAEEYSEAFGVMLLSNVVDQVRVRSNVHIPRELQQKVTGYMQKLEAERDERVREFIRAQDEELERTRQRTKEQSKIVAEIVDKLHPQQQAPVSPGMHKGTAGTSGLAAMLRGSTGGGGMEAAGANPLARGSSYTGAQRLHGPAHSFSDDELDLEDETAFSAMGAIPPRSSQGGLGRHLGQRTNSGRSQLSDALEREEDAFGDFSSEQTGAASGVNMQRPGGNLSQMLAGSMPIQIPAFGSSLTNDISLSRREHRQRADEIEMSRRREQILRGMPKTFVPPHQLMNQIDNDSSEMIVGSKPRDLYGMPRRHAPG